MAPLILRTSIIRGPSQYIIIISKKIDKRATKRNRMRRIIRESLRHLVPFDRQITCIVKENITEHTQKEIENIIKVMLQ